MEFHVNHPILYIMVGLIIAAVMAQSVYFLVSLPSGYLFGFVFDLGLTGVWFSFPLGLTCAGLLFWVRYRRTMKRLLMTQISPPVR